MDISQTFSQVLRTSMDGFLWALEQVPSDRLGAPPPKELGDWVVEKQLFHMVYYESTAVLPIMKQLLGGLVFDWATYDEYRAWALHEKDKARLDDLVDQFKSVREEQIAILPQFTPELWHRVGESNWGLKTPYWFVSKTGQHTYEHTNYIMQIALFWDDILVREAKQKSASG